MNSTQQGDSAPICLVRVSYCCRFLDLDAFGIAPDGADTGCCGHRAFAIALAFSILTHSA